MMGFLEWLESSPMRALPWRLNQYVDRQMSVNHD